MNILNYLPDVIVILIVILAIITGYAKGFVRTFLHAIGWVLSMVLAFVWSPKVSDWIIKNTEVYENMNELLTNKFADSLPGTTATFDMFPSSLSEGIGAATGNISTEITTMITDVIFTVFSFMLVVFATKLVLYILISILSKKNRRGLTGMVDGVLGGLAGGVTGIFLVYALMALLIPVTALVGPDLTQTISEAIDKSVIADSMYNNNLIITVFKEFLTGVA